MWRRSHVGSRRGISGVISTILLVAITVVAATVLYEVKIRTPPLPTTIDFFLQGGLSYPVYGDGSDCTGGMGAQTCETMAALFIIITGTSPTGLLLSSLFFTLTCNGTPYLTSSFTDMEWIPGASGAPGPNAPQLGHCGSYTPPKAAFNRLAFFEQLEPGSLVLQPGDKVVVFMNTPGSWTATDDDYHGIPSWCFTGASSCPLTLDYVGGGSAPSGVVTSVNYLSLYPG
jgi:flagellin-like protein